MREVDTAVGMVAHMVVRIHQEVTLEDPLAAQRMPALPTQWVFTLVAQGLPVYPMLAVDM